MRVMFPTKIRKLARFGLIFKVFTVFLLVFAVAALTIYTLIAYLDSSITLSRDIVKNRVEALGYARDMIDNLLSMEENQKKYAILQQEEYKKYYLQAQKNYVNNIWRVVWFKYEGSDIWGRIYEEFKERFPSLVDGKELSDDPWVPEETLNSWLSMIVRARKDNEKVIEETLRSLYDINERAVRSGYIGVGLAVLSGIGGCFYLGYSLYRPLKELRRGLRELTRFGRMEPLKALSSDELGDLAKAFNEMTGRLAQEEKMRADFIDMLSHEIRTPLTSIRESVNLMREEVLGVVNEKQRRFLDIASGELERMSGLLSRLMQVSSMAPETFRPTLSEINPAQALEEAIRNVDPTAQAKDIAINICVAGNPPNILADPELLEHALLNILSNAIKFSPAESEINVAVEAVDGGSTVLFSIKDQGAGISEADKPHIFQRYFRGFGGTKGVDGLGLGLTIVKDAVKSQNGQIWFTSRQGEGSTFYFTIPAKSGN